jgi:hypothetical protein
MGLGLGEKSLQIRSIIRSMVHAPKERPSEIGIDQREAIGGRVDTVAQVHTVGYRPIVAGGVENRLIVVSRRCGCQVGSLEGGRKHGHVRLGYRFAGDENPHALYRKRLAKKKRRKKKERKRNPEGMIGTQETEHTQAICHMFSL